MLSTTTRVEVLPGFIARLFGAKPRCGYVACNEIGQKSRQTLYTVVYDDGSVGAVFENELRVLR